MRFSRVVSLSALTLLAATLGIKVATLDRKPRVDTGRLLHGLVESLRREGYAARLEGRRTRWIAAERGSCRLKVRYYAPHGTQQDAIEDLGSAVGPTRYGYAGEWVAEPPKLRPLLEFYVQRELARMGIQWERPAIVAVAASPGCGAPPHALLHATYSFRTSG